MNNSKKYCAKCKNQDTSTKLCAPVEELLLSVVVIKEHDRPLPKEFMQKYRGPNGEWPVREESKEEQIIELYFEDRRKQHDIALLVGCSDPYVSKVIKKCRIKNH